MNDFINFMIRVFFVAILVVAFLDINKSKRGSSRADRNPSLIGMMAASSIQSVHDRGYLIPIRIVFTGRYLQMLEEYKEMQITLAKCEGSYYLKDAARWTAEHGDTQTLLEEERAKVQGLTIENEILRDIITGLREVLKADLPAQERFRDTKTGRYLPNPERLPERVPEILDEEEPDEEMEEAEEPEEEISGDFGWCDLDEELDDEDQEPEEELHEPEEEPDETLQDKYNSAPVMESKSLRAYRMSLNGTGREVIAHELGISPQSVRTYIRNGRIESENADADIKAWRLKESGKKLDEIARILEVPENSVKLRVNNGYKKLQERNASA